MKQNPIGRHGSENPLRGEYSAEGLAGFNAMEDSTSPHRGRNVELYFSFASGALAYARTYAFSKKTADFLWKQTILGVYKIPNGWLYKISGIAIIRIKINISIKKKRIRKKFSKYYLSPPHFSSRNSSVSHFNSVLIVALLKVHNKGIHTSLSNPRRERQVCNMNRPWL